MKSVSITSLWLALSVTACDGESASTSESLEPETSGPGAGTADAIPGGPTSAGVSASNDPGGAATSSGSASSSAMVEPTGTGATTAAAGSGGGPASGGSSASGTGGSSVADGGSTTANGGETSAAGNASQNSGGESTLGSGGQTTATGGNPNGGGGGGGGAGASAGSTLPAFVTSAENDYWNTDGQVTVVTAGPADLTIDESTSFQRWDGFGGSFNEMGWDALAVVSAEIPNALTLLFDAENGANFVYGRIPLGASDYSMSWYTLAETPDDYAMDAFSIERDRDMLIPFIQAAQQVRADLRFFASPWVVPDWMMDGRNMRSDAQTLDAYALYFAKFVEAYGAEGIPVEAVHPQNEPGYARVTWTHELYIDFIKSYLGPKFAELGVSAEIWCGTMSHPDDGILATTLANDADAMEYVTGFGLQWNLQSTVATLAAKGPVMQTEHKCGNYDFETPYWDQSRYDPDQAQNDHLYGEESWQLIRDWIGAGVNSYIAWNMVLDSVGKSLDGWPQNALLVVDRAARELIVTPAYYAFRHYSQYIAPGATRIGVSGSNDALAFKNPDGSIVTEIYNGGDAAKPTTVSVGNAMYQFEVPAHGWATFRVVE